MQFMLRLFSAFCIATVLAQATILTMSATKGNINGTTLTKTIALLNGIDISGDQMRKQYDEWKKAPVPSYEDVVKQRAMEDRDLVLRSEIIQQSIQQMNAMRESLQRDEQDFDRRKDAFYELLDKEKAKVEDEGLAETKRILSELSPEQAKVQLQKMIEAKDSTIVVAIVKGMQPDKRKKILGEFTSTGEDDQLYQIIKQIQEGEPTASLIDQARQGKSPSASQ